jgi:hypothetical protein
MRLRAIFEIDSYRGVHVSERTPYFKSARRAISNDHPYREPQRIRRCKNAQGWAFRAVDGNAEATAA